LHGHFLSREKEAFHKKVCGTSVRQLKKKKRNQKGLSGGPTNKDDGFRPNAKVVSFDPGLGRNADWVVERGGALLKKDQRGHREGSVDIH